MLDLLGNSRFVFAGLSGSMSYLLYGYLEPVLAIRLDDFNMDQIQISLIFCVITVFYVPSCVLVAYIPKSVEKRLILILATFGCVAANLVQGPSKFLDFSDDLFLIVLG